MGNRLDTPAKIINKASYQKMFNLYYRAMIMFASRYVQDADDVKDIVQDSFIVLWDKRYDLKSEDSIKSYLYATVRNKCLNFIRDNKENNDEEHLNMLKSDDNFFQNLLKEETLRLFYEALNDLNENAKSVMLLTIEGYNRDEIAERLSLSIDTVKYHKKAATSVLRKKLGQHFYLLTFLI